MQLGMHWAIDEALAERFVAARGDDDALEDLVADLEETGGVPGCETDKAWDPISCALAPSGSERDPDEWPWTGVVLGREELQADPELMLLTLMGPADVAQVSAALLGLEETAFARAYDQMPEELRNPEYGPDERDYAWGFLTELTAFMVTAADAGAHVLFHVNG